MRLRQGWVAIPIPCLVHSIETGLISDIAMVATWTLIMS